MKHKLKFTPLTQNLIGASLTPLQLNFVSWLIDSNCHLYIHQSVVKCECGRLLFFVGTKLGRRARGLFCASCSFDGVPWL